QGPGASGQLPASSALQADAGQQQWRPVAPQLGAPQSKQSPVDQVREERRAFAGVAQANAPSSSPIDQVRQERRDWVQPGDAWRPPYYQRSAYVPAEPSPAVGIAGPAALAPSQSQSATQSAATLPQPAPAITSRPPLPTENPW